MLARDVFAKPHHAEDPSIWTMLRNPRALLSGVGLASKTDGRISRVIFLVQIAFHA